MSDVIVYILGVIVSVALSLASNIHFGEKERGWCVSDVSTVHTLVFSSNFKRMVGQIQRFLALNHLHPKGNHQNFSSSVSTVSEELRNKQTHKLTDTL